VHPRNTPAPSDAGSSLSGRDSHGPPPSPLPPRGLDLRALPAPGRAPPDMALVRAGRGRVRWGTNRAHQAMTLEFAQLGSQLVYGHPELRPQILRALRVLVDQRARAGL
jgi:hypothetical protein